MAPPADRDAWRGPFDLIRLDTSENTKASLRLKRNTHRLDPRCPGQEPGLHAAPVVACEDPGAMLAKFTLCPDLGWLLHAFKKFWNRDERWSW